MTSRIGAMLLAPALLAAGPLHAQHARLDVVPHAGYMIFGDLWRGPFGTRLSVDDGPVYGVQVGLNLSRSIALTGAIVQARSDLRVGVPLLGGIGVGSSETVLYDGGLLLRLPYWPVTPFAQAGFGGARSRLANGPIELTSTSPAWHVGGGIDVDLSRSIGLRLQARDYIGRFDFEDAMFVDVRSRTAHNLALTAGLRIGL
jgi:hypothetical protein